MWAARASGGRPGVGRGLPGARGRLRLGGAGGCVGRLRLCRGRWSARGRKRVRWIRGRTPGAWAREGTGVRGVGGSARGRGAHACACATGVVARAVARACRVTSASCGPRGFGRRQAGRDPGGPEALGGPAVVVAPVPGDPARAARPAEPGVARSARCGAIGPHRCLVAPATPAKSGAARRSWWPGASGGQAAAPRPVSARRGAG